MSSTALRIELQQKKRQETNGKQPAPTDIETLAAEKKDILHSPKIP